MNRTALLILMMLFWGATGLCQEWQTNFEAAKAAAEIDEKPIILVFQGSDWCAPCIKLQREVWSTAAFKTYAADHYIMVQVDFPRKRKNALSKEQTLANKGLAEKYNQKGIFPLVVLLDADGRELGQTSYKRLPPAEYIKELNSYIN